MSDSEESLDFFKIVDPQLLIDVGLRDRGGQVVETFHDAGSKGDDDTYTRLAGAQKFTQECRIATKFRVNPDYITIGAFDRNAGDHDDVGVDGVGAFDTRDSKTQH